jgi:hypothetical protein
MAEQKIPSNPREYPRIIDLNGQRVRVEDHYHHSAMAGQEYDKDAKLVVKGTAMPVAQETAGAESAGDDRATAEALFGRPKATPPKLETVLAAGYSEKAAKAIVAEEKFKFENGIQPYGDKPEEDVLEQLRTLAAAVPKPPPGSPGGPADPLDLEPPAHDYEPTAEELFGKKKK